MNFYIKSLLILLIGCVSTIFSVCPDAKLIDPCVCNAKDSMIICGGNSNIDLKKIFTQFNDNGVKHYDKLILTNSAIDSLEDNVFSGVSFNKISITGAYSLKRVSKWAFNASAFTLEEFEQKGGNQLTDEHIEELFDALSSLVSVNRLFLELTKATRVPDNAFKIINGRQTKLETIHLNYIGGSFGSLQTIGNRAFYYLDNLKAISIANQPIKLLKAQSFDFEHMSTTDFDLHLEATKINASSFEQGIFLHSNRPMTIEMSNNELEYLDEKVFKPILELPDSKMITIIVENNPFACDCRMFWLLKGKGEPHNYQEKVMQLECKNTGQSIFELNINSTQFSNCQ